MGAIKNLLHEVEEHLANRNYAEALALLQPWGDEAPAQLWGVLLMMAEAQKDPAWDFVERVPDRYLDYLTETNAHTLRALIEYCEGRPNHYSDTQLETAYQMALDGLNTDD